ncbi:MAG: hypothetical protein ACRD1Y_13000 [Terriglobales bacterium]
MGAVPVLDAPMIGVPQMVRGGKELNRGVRERNVPVSEGGAADVLEGAMQMGEPLAAGAGLVAPVATVLGLGAGYVGAKTASYGAKKAGAGRQAQRLASDVVGVAQVQ